MSNHDSLVVLEVHGISYFVCRCDGVKSLGPRESFANSFIEELCQDQSQGLYAIGNNLGT